MDLGGLDDDELECLLLPPLLGGEYFPLLLGGESEFPPLQCALEYDPDFGDLECRLQSFDPLWEEDNMLEESNDVGSSLDDFECLFKSEGEFDEDLNLFSSLWLLEGSDCLDALECVLELVEGEEYSVSVLDSSLLCSYFDPLFKSLFFFFFFSVFPFRLFLGNAC